MWTIFKVFIEFVTVLLLFYVLVFGREAYGILVPWPGIEPAPRALEGEVLTTGLPGKSRGSKCFFVFVFVFSPDVFWELNISEKFWYQAGKKESP